MNETASTDVLNHRSGKGLSADKFVYDYILY